MKNSTFRLFISTLALFILVAWPIAPVESQTFQRLYGTSLDNTFSKVIRDGSNYYVLGQDESTQGSPMHATVTRLGANGIHQWTLRLDIPSVWNDAVLTPTGDLFVVGSTLPGDATNKSIMGLVTPSGGGNFIWLRTYDVPGREGLSRIVQNPNPQNASFPYYILGSQFDPNGNATWDDVILMNINAAGTFNWKKRYASIDDDEFSRDLEVMPNGNLIISGNRSTQGLIYLTDNSGTLFTGITPSGHSFTYADLAQSSGGGFFAVGNTFPGFTPYLMKYDNNFIAVWDATISGLTSIHQVWEESSSGRIYVTARGVFNGISRSVLLRFSEMANLPSLDWVKYLDNGETNYSGGLSTLLSSNQIAYADGRTPSSGGFGQVCAFVSISDMDLTTCMTAEDFADVQTLSILYDAPNLPPIEFYDFPTGTDIVSAALNWQENDACNTGSCQADFIITPIGNCGHYQVTNTSTGVQPLTYSWCNGMTTQDLDLLLPCGPHTFCLTITDAEGCTASYTESISVTDNVPPVARCALPFGVVLDANCTYTLIPSQIDGGSTDNCQIQSLSVSPAVLSGCGVFPVTLTVTDWCGNTSSCVTMIQTIEDVPPVIRCPSDQILTTGNSNCTLVVNGIQWTSLTDNCSTTSVSYSVSGATIATGNGDASGLTFNQGLSLVTYTAIDDCGNTSSCSFTIKVVCVCNCINNLVQNSGFVEGAVAGNLGTTGHADDWFPYATPQVVPGDSCCDDVSIQMFGWLHNGEAIYQQSMGFQAGHHYKISFCARFVSNNSYGNNVSFGFTGANGYILPFQCTTGCEDIGSSPQVFNLNWATYTLPVWTPKQNWDRFYVRTFHTSGIKSWGRIDNICVQEVNRSCCTDEEEFVANMRNAVTFSFDESTQEGICTIGNLPECDSIAFIDWGDGHIEVGPFGGNTVRRHKFLDHLLARIQFQGYEYNAEIEPNETCFEHLFEDSLDVYSLDTCICNSFAEMFIRGSRGAYSQLVDCGEAPIALSCLPSGTSYTLTGLINCTGNQCNEETAIEWTLSGPGGLFSGTALAYPYFEINLLPSYLGQSGLYTLSLNGECGLGGCPCEIQFTIDCPSACPCAAQDITNFSTRVERGFAVLYPDNSCTICFTPLALNDCETVQWYLDSQPSTVGSSIGVRTFCYEFAEPGDYDVIMEVTRKKDDGGNCDKQMRTQRVLPCHIPLGCVDPFMDNPDFNLGAQAGGFNSGGMSRGWSAASGDPVVIEGEPGSADGWTILLSGNLDTADILSRSESICLDKSEGVFATTVKGSKSNTSERRTPGTLNIYLKRGWSFPPTFSVLTPCEGIDCYALASVPLPSTNTDEWFDIGIPYDLREWIALDSCNDFSGVLVRPVIFISNAYGTNQGAEKTYSYAQLDKVCFSRAIVAVNDPDRRENIRLYPNPTSGSISVELNAPAGSDMSVQISSLIGQVFFEKQMEVGKLMHNLETHYLPHGLYFLRVIAEGRMVSVSKFVKL
ncbi:MAG: T9SS type A sorting domain-containing protein [Saprospiraceae bacterium]|nr:T9SS type A sorting domain-containing protein [Saprospiraceae bacterium]